MTSGIQEVDDLVAAVTRAQGKIADQVKRADAIADKAEQQFC